MASRNKFSLCLWSSRSWSYSVRSKLNRCREERISLQNNYSFSVYFRSTTFLLSDIPGISSDLTAVRVFNTWCMKELLPLLFVLLNGRNFTSYLNCTWRKICASLSNVIVRGKGKVKRTRREDQDALCAIVLPPSPYLGWLATNVCVCYCQRSSEMSYDKYAADFSLKIVGVWTPLRGHYCTQYCFEVHLASYPRNVFPWLKAA
jgi:hypothetical protein